MNKRTCASTTLNLSERTLFIDLLKKRTTTDIHTLLVLLSHTPQSCFILRFLFRQHIILEGNRTAQCFTISSNSCTRCISICKSTYESFMLRSTFPNEELSKLVSFSYHSKFGQKSPFIKTIVDTIRPLYSEIKYGVIGSCHPGAHLPSSCLIMVLKLLAQMEQMENKQAHSHSHLPS